MIKVFIDGSEGTTGLKIRERLISRADVSLISLPDEKKKESEAKKAAMSGADVVVLCLPDAAAIESATLAESLGVKIIDASTAHRTASGWVYGFPELRGFREKIKGASKVAVPGCHATGFLAIVYPLVEMEILSDDYPVVCHSVTGYSGGGKSMIAEYKSEKRNIELDSPRQYALTQNHKHLREMTKVAGLKSAPAFSPIVADYFSGMAVTVPLFARLLNKNIEKRELFEMLSDYYSAEKAVKVSNCDGEVSFLAANTFSGTDGLEITVAGNEDRITLISRFDNLGKGASGAAVQCLNIMAGAEEFLSLKL
ncbi:MAG TPA: N-acetyl-gamma-glutamyl-phosphate reductase [Eubacteriales bacterium]|nr:N-acetyl-gamma-glutamyl-phosphate reductase [Clostridia bacterium]HRR89887.1 N-acetyl-gamma-glutamyl-phosphate reductase [Eubacteriales bacterium]HRU83946.1 N-acetyl-gamma-glutamyl-phosphate reductase [Eubacteriales bacterium]